MPNDDKLVQGYWQMPLPWQILSSIKFSLIAAYLCTVKGHMAKGPSPLIIEAPRTVLP